MAGGFLAILFLFLFAMGTVTAVHANGQGKTMWWGVVVFLFGVFGLVFYAISLASGSNNQQPAPTGRQ